MQGGRSWQGMYPNAAHRSEGVTSRSQGRRLERGTLARKEAIMLQERHCEARKNTRQRGEKKGKLEGL